MKQTQVKSTAAEPNSPEGGALPIAGRDQFFTICVFETVGFRDKIKIQSDAIPCGCLNFTNEIGSPHIQSLVDDHSIERICIDA